MAESYRPFSKESTAEKEDDGKTDKKDQRKRATEVKLGALLSSDRFGKQHTHRFGGDALRPSPRESSKMLEYEPVRRERVAAELKLPDHPAITEDQQLQPVADESRRLYDAVVASTSEENGNPGNTVKSKKRGSEPTVTYGEKRPLVGENSSYSKARPATLETVSQDITLGTNKLEAVSSHQPGMSVKLARLSQDEQSHRVQQESYGVSGDESDDAKFNEIVENSLGNEAPGHVQFHEQAAGVSPLEMHSSHNDPSISPIIERGGWGSGDDKPWQQPAGGLSNPRVYEDVSAIRARQEIDDLYHTSRENGIAGAVGLIGLGLVLEHIVAKRRDKKLKRQLKAQERQLKKTNQALKLEQRSLQTTQHKYERMGASQTVTAEQLRHIMPAVQSAEVAVVAAATGAVRSAFERSKQTVPGLEQGGSPEGKIQERALAERLRTSPELGRAIKHNPELKGVTEVQTLKQTLETARETAVQQEQQMSGLRREIGYEHLYRKRAQVGRSPMSGGSGDNYSMPMLPSPQQSTDGVSSDHYLPAHALSGKRNGQPAHVVTSVVAATVLVVLAAIIVMVYLR